LKKKSLTSVQICYEISLFLYKLVFVIFALRQFCDLSKIISEFLYEMWQYTVLGETGSTQY